MEPHTRIAAAAMPDHPRELEHNAEYRAHLFGEFRIHVGPQGRRIDRLGRRKALGILHWFLLHPGAPATAEQLIDLLWPESDPEKSMTNFHVSIHSLRRLLEPTLGQGQESRFIRRHSNKVYTFETGEMWWSDVADLELTYCRGHEADLRGEQQRARFYYRKVAAYGSRRPLLEDCHGEWIEQFRRRFRVMSSHSLGRLIELDAISGDHEEMLENAYALLQLEPFHEQALRIAVESCLVKNYRSQAQRLLHGYCVGMGEQLGMPPASDLVDLRDRLAQGGKSMPQEPIPEFQRTRRRNRVRDLQHA